MHGSPIPTLAKNARVGHPQYWFCQLWRVNDMTQERHANPDENQVRVSSLKERLTKAQQLVRKHVSSTTSLVDEPIAERREDEKRESDPRP
jgi:hypothetical protein